MLFSSEGPGTALSSDLPDLIRLWSLCFHEEETEAGFFLTQRFIPEHTFVWRRNGQVCAMISLIPVYSISCDGRSYRGGYLYAIATRPDLQGQGIFQKLHRFAAEQAQTMELDFLCLIPASESLFSLYSRTGYETWYLKEKLPSHPIPKQNADLQLRNCTIEEYLSVPFTASALSYETDQDRIFVLKQHLHYGGFLKKARLNQKVFVLAGDCTDGVLTLSPGSSVHPDILLCAAAELAVQTNASQILLPQGCTSVCDPLTNNSSIPYGMGFWLCKEHPRRPSKTMGLMYT